MTDSEKLDLILTKLQRIEDKLGITRDLEIRQYEEIKRRQAFYLLSPEEQERQNRLAQACGQPSLSSGR